MLAPLACSTGSIGHDDKAWSPAEFNAIHRSVTTALLAHGRLVFPSKDAKAEFRAAVKDLATKRPDAGKLWEAALQYGRTDSCDRVLPLEALDDLESLAACWCSSVKLVIVDPAHAELLGVDPNSYGCVHDVSGLEVTRHDRIDLSETVQTLRALANDQVLPPGTDRDAVFGERFGPCAVEGCSIHVVDGYLGVNLVQQGHRATELGWLARRIREECTGTTLNIYTAHEDAEQAEKIRRAAKKAVAAGNGASGGLARVKLFLTPRRHRPSKRAGRQSYAFPHDRHIRFGSVGFTLSAGLDRFRSRQTREPVTVGYVWQPTQVGELKRSEQKVRDQLGRPPIDLVR